MLLLVILLALFNFLFTIWIATDIQKSITRALEIQREIILRLRKLEGKR